MIPFLDLHNATFLNVKLPHLDSDNEKRKVIANRYLAGILSPKIVAPEYYGGQNHVFHLFGIRTENKSALQNYLITKDEADFVVKILNEY